MFQQYKKTEQYEILFVDMNTTWIIQSDMDEQQPNGK